MASVRLDVAAYAKVSAVAALEGIDKSAWMSRVITEAVRGVVVFDRRESSEGVNSPTEGRSSDAA